MFNNCILEDLSVLLSKELPPTERCCARYIYVAPFETRNVNERQRYDRGGERTITRCANRENASAGTITRQCFRWNIYERMLPLESLQQNAFASIHKIQCVVVSGLRACGVFPTRWHTALCTTLGGVQVVGDEMVEC